MDVIIVEPKKKPYIKKIDDCQFAAECFASVFGMPYILADTGETIDLWPDLNNAEEINVSDDIPFCIFNPKAKEQGQPFNQTVMGTDIYGKFLMIAYDKTKKEFNSFGVKNFNKPQMLYLIKKYDKS